MTSNVAYAMVHTIPSSFASQYLLAYHTALLISQQSCKAPLAPLLDQRQVLGLLIDCWIVPIAAVMLSWMWSSFSMTLLSKLSNSLNLNLMFKT